MKRAATLIPILLLLALPPARAAAEGAPEREPGLDWLAIPLMQFNDDSGFVYGLKLELIDFQPDRSPHAWNLELKLLHSTTNRHQHRASLDIPQIAGSPWRLSARAELLHIDDANFFGLGNDTPNTNDPLFHQFRLTEPRLKIIARRSLNEYLFVSLGLLANLTLVDATPGSALDALSPPGRDGGLGVGGLLSLGIDTRDDELVPTEGLFLELYARGNREALGSDFGFLALGLTAQLYARPLSWLVLAQRLMLERLSFAPPFYEQQRIGGTSDFIALGGVFSQRGFPEGRFAGRSKLLSNTELRASLPPLWQHLHLGLGAFLDLSRVLDHRDIIDGLHPSVGASLFINWDNAFVFRIEQGFSNEDSLFYIEGRYLF